MLALNPFSLNQWNIGSNSLEGGIGISWNFDGPPQDFAKHFCRLQVGQLAAGDFQFEAHEVLRPLESQRDESADVIRSDRLVRLVGAHGIIEFAL